jgi:class 3 adenylate cyclase/predicted ATPase
MDVGDWLKSLGLGQYLALFREHEIDAEVLPELTDADLEKLGVPFGHRKRLLKAIAALGTAASEQPEAASPRAARLSDASAERRHLTVMFCDLAGSTTISASLDAEDWLNLVSAYLDAASQAVAQMGGHVAKKLGDGIMALFGFPVAQENDPERAVRAALAVQRALSELNRKGQASGAPELVARIGIAAGAVVVDSAGEIFGDAPNIAARVQALAEPGTVLVTANVQGQTAGRFVAEDRGAHELKGVPAPVTLYRIVRASGGGRRSGQRALTPFVGRDEEITMLLRRWERARQGEGQFVVIVGEPGIGKSRLIEEFHGRLRDTPHTWVEWSSSQLLQNTPLHPIAEWGRLRFGADMPSEKRLADLENTLRLIGLDATEYASLLAPLVEIPLPEDRVAKFAPEELRRQQLAAMAGWILAGARSQPVALAFEDLQWADPTSLDLMRALAMSGALAPLMVVATARPEFGAPWGVRSHHCAITLSPLDRAQIRQMVAEIASRHALSRETAEGVVERTGGVPLFVEEVTRLLLERGERGGAQAIPPTLEQSLTARLDRLGAAREVAMVGAVLGRDFSFSLLRAVAGMEDAPLRQALERLAEADILLVEGLPPDADYRFKHALIQDAAYENLLKSRRQALHRRVAETLRGQFPDRADAEPEALAHHFTQAGLTEEGIEWWGKAGNQALRRSAYREAVAHLGKAIAMADKAGDEAKAAVASRRRRAQLQSSYAQAMMFSRGYAAEETTAAFAHAKTLAMDADHAPGRMASLYGIWIGKLVRGELASAWEAAEIFRREAEAEGSSPASAAAYRFLGVTAWLQGDFALARSNVELAIRTLDAAGTGDGRISFGMDTAITATCYLAHVTWQLGNPTQARELILDADRLAVERGHVPTLANTSIYVALFELIGGDAKTALPATDRLARLSRDHGLSLHSASAALLSTLAGARLGSASDGAAAIQLALAVYTRQGNRMFAPLFQGLLAELEAEAPSANSALTRIDGALALAQRTGERWTDALLHRIRGDMLSRADPDYPARAEQAYLAAVQVAREQGARSFGLQAALKLAKLYRSIGRPSEARDVLARALEGFSPTPEMLEIAEAQALLVALAETGGD